MKFNRRSFLGCLTAAGSSLAGCTGSPDASGGTEDSQTSSSEATGDEEQSRETTANGKGLERHPAATNLGSQPHIGPPPADADGVIVEFADPSCPGCARFEQKTYPKIKLNLVDPGKVSFIYREFPNVAPWGELASQAVEGTFEQSATAFWRLKSHYYENTDEFTEDNVLNRTETYLQQETDIQADVVVNGVRNDEFAEAVQQDIEAANDAGVGGTPAFFLFQSGSFRTTIEGPQGYGVFKNALGY